VSPPADNTKLTYPEAWDAALDRLNRE